jgi:antitoxin component of MazEF toxin-antitoxin module
MKTIELTLARIGNSRGIRLPADLIRKHGLEPGMVLEDRGHELVLRPKGGPRKLSWEETAREMVAAAEDWSDWDTVSADGLDAIPWERPAPAAGSKRIAKSVAKSRSTRKS